MFVINTDAKYARWPCLCFILIIHLLRHKELVSTVTRLVSSVRETCSNWKGQGRPREGGGLFRIIAYNKSPALHFNNSSNLPPSLPLPPGAQAFHQVIRTGLGWAQISSQSSLRWDEYKARNTVKRFNKTNKPTSSQQDGKRGKCYKVLTVNSFTGQRGTEWNQMRPDERRNKLKIYWRQPKMQETRTEWQGGGSGAQRHFCVHIGLMSLCYKSFFFIFTFLFFLFFFFYSSGELNRSILFYQNIHVLNVKWI